MDLVHDLDRDGYAGPLPLLSPAQCEALLATLTDDGNKRRQIWRKSGAVKGRGYFDLAIDPRLLDVAKTVLGEDIILWGARLIVKRGNDVHPFHTDVESMDPNGGFLSVWMGLSNTSRESGLKFVRGSHRFGVTMQQANHEMGIARTASTDDSVVTAARRYDREASIEQPAVNVGEAIFFDGRVWHGSHNLAGQTRTAVLIQYARADRPVYLPARYEYPIEMRTDARPPVLLLSGRTQIGVNRLSQTPVRVAPNAAFPMLPPPEVALAPFASLPHFRGQTPVLKQMDAHSSVLAPGQMPHPLHHHKEEEVLIVLSGTAELHTAADGEGTGLTTTAVGPGDFAYYPALQWHTLKNTGDRPVLYTMFKWVGDAERSERQGDVLTFVNASEILRQQPAEKSNRGIVLDLKSRWLKRLQSHVSIVGPGGGYDAHTDPYDVAIVLLEGEIESLGRTVAAPAMLYHPARQPHGLKATANGPARYVVFEFHRGKRAAPSSMLVARAKDLARRALRKVKRLAGRR